MNVASGYVDDFIRYMPRPLTEDDRVEPKHDTSAEQAEPTNIVGAAGKELYLRNLRKVLIQKGYTGEALERRMTVVLARDPRRLAAMLSEPRKR